MYSQILKNLKAKTSSELYRILNLDSAKYRTLLAKIHIPFSESSESNLQRQSAAAASQRAFANA
jgi:hypothetical protein